MKLGLLLLATLTAALGASQVSAEAQGGDLFGIWRNPKNSVHVELRPCGEAACGYVVWATDKAKAAARRGGTADLVGLQIFREMTPTADGGWKGKVFVPDLNKTVSGRAEPLDGDRLLAKGCLVARVLCKSQIWTRV